MIDCTDEYTLARSVALEVARIMEMEIEHVSLKNHDIEIALAQARFHAEIWHLVQRTPDIVRHVSRLPISQRRAFIGNARVLLRPDISAELIVAFPESIFLFQDDEI